MYNIHIMYNLYLFKCITYKSYLLIIYDIILYILYVYIK